MNCKNCKFWEYHNTGRESWHSCGMVDCTELGYKVADDAFSLYAEALDNSGLETGLITGPMFGCIKFVPCSGDKP